MDILENHIATLNRLCEKHNVDKMYLFGSALKENFSEKSDIDFLVRFQPIELADYFENYMSFKEDLRMLLGREIDLVEEQTLKNPVLIKFINQSKELVYG
jgi:predicted nucleotidyltransferase